MKPVDVISGHSPIILAMPHSGLYVPDNIYSRFNDIGCLLADTDWHIDRLYTDLLPNVTMVRANFHRYVIDPNRDPSGTSLYPDQNTTQLCPLKDFNGANIYRKGQAPNMVDIQDRISNFHSPYHTALSNEIKRIKNLHGIAILYDCHSIRSKAPFLFHGRLPDFNIGTNNGETCHPLIQKTVAETCTKAKDFTSVENGRFKGGWTTRHYGRPTSGIHAIQMELAQSNYMQEIVPFNYLESRADALRTILKSILSSIEDCVLEGKIS